MGICIEAFPDKEIRNKDPDKDFTVMFYHMVCLFFF